MLPVSELKDARDFHGRPNQPNYRPTQRTTTNCSCCDIFLVLLVMFIFSFLIYLGVWGIVIHVDVPKFHVNDITLTEFTLSTTNNTLYYNLAVNVTFRNPSNRNGIHFDKIKAMATYHGNKLMTKQVQGFYLGHKKENNNVSAVFRGERLLMLYNGDEKVLYESESKDGVYDIELKFLYKTRTRALSLNTNKSTSKVVWGLKVPLGVEVPTTTKFEITAYSYEECVDWDTD